MARQAYSRFDVNLMINVADDLPTEPDVLAPTKPRPVPHAILPGIDIRSATAKNHFIMRGRSLKSTRVQ
jgi:hypothetical protein